MSSAIDDDSLQVGQVDKLFCLSIALGINFSLLQHWGFRLSVGLGRAEFAFFCWSIELDWEPKILHRG